MRLLTWWQAPKRRYPEEGVWFCCPGVLQIDPFTRIANLDRPRRMCGHGQVVTFQAGQSGKPIRCTNFWCGWVGMVIRGPV